MTANREGDDPAAAGGGRPAVRADVAAFVLASDARAAGQARSLLHDRVGVVPASVAADAALMMSEIVSNAVLHGAPDITLNLQVGASAVTVAVHDCGSAMPTVCGDSPRSDQTSGRGLMIVAAMADEWGIEASSPPPGKTVWFSIN